MNSNDERIRDMLDSSDVPSELSPEKIREMLDEKAPKKKRKNISKAVTRAVAGTAACAVIAGTSVYFAGQRNYDKSNYSGESSNALYPVNPESSESESGAPQRPDSILQGANDYKQIYNLLRAKSLKEDLSSILNFSFGGKPTNDSDTVFNADGIAGEMPKNENEEIMPPAKGDSPESDRKFSETYNQEENVLEADIVKTDGDCIYLVTQRTTDRSDGSTDSYLEIAQADNGKFTDSAVVNISDSLGLKDSADFTHAVDVREMYLYNDMVVVLGTVWQTYNGAHDFEIYNNACDCLCGGWYDSETSVFVNVYTKGTDPQLIGTYTQDGNFSDVRITPDGTMYIVSDYRSGQPSYVTKEHSYTEYIPEYSVNGSREFIPAERIMLPPEGFTPNEALFYTIIGGVDLSESGKIANTDILSFTGNSGSVYCTAENIYLACGYDKTKLVRIALTNGLITPVAEGSVEGYVKDQFSMSEYDGYFRIAVTKENWVESAESFDDAFATSEVASVTLDGTDNILYVMDKDFNEVGKLAGIGKGETIRSVSFSGSIAYIVTFRQTDPLFSIDISDPTSPKILDELKVTGFSSYMQQWQDGLLLGFGMSATEEGSVTGYKLTMFDNSDPNSLRDLDTVEFDSYEDGGERFISRYTEASTERKALLIAPEKNLIGLPVQVSTDTCEYDDTAHRETAVFEFYSFENGKFVKRGELAKPSENYCLDDRFRRAVYIDDYVYAVSASEFIAADIATITKTDSVSF